MARLNEVEEALCSLGPVTVTVFVVGAGHRPLPPEAFHLAGLVPDEVFPFEPAEQPPRIAPRGLLSYDLSFTDTSLDLRTYTREALRRVCADGPAVAWAAFEGTFHYDRLLTADVASSVYGYCVSGAEPVVTFEAATLRGESWKALIAQARSALDALLDDEQENEEEEVEVEVEEEDEEELWLARHGLRPDARGLGEVRALLAERTRRERDSQGEGNTLLMRLCCVQLCHAGDLGDIELIWNAKSASFDASHSIDVQLLCGAGLQATKEFLASQTSPQSSAALERILHSEATGDFDGFSPARRFAYDAACYL
ncbi:hypothetical protein ABT160_07550 [Streptomyces sp. NPDC001941]|uniref:hypothetical protein n=1 Tax=Streptomyces sp. NPDC001941 TaxID=3154659 RepID=UPI0033309A0F